jgi:anti-sigma factor RsiW
VPDHPDHEQLAAFQAGDGDRRQRSDVEAHLAGCPSCAELVASVEDARRGLILLEEPELPPGLHDRLAAAVAGEATQVLPQRPTPWYRRPVAWGAAAALLLAALVVPLLNQGGSDLNTAGGGSGGGDQAQEAAGAAGGAELPVIRVPGEVSAALVRSRLAGDDLAKQALERARADAQSSGGTAAAPPPRESQGPAAATQPPGQGQEDGYRSDGAPSSPGATADQGSCLAAAESTADPATRPLVPAFYVEGTYQGRQATVLVTTSGGQPGRADLWVFPRGNCSTAPLATERVR